MMINANFLKSLRPKLFILFHFLKSGGDEQITDGGYAGVSFIAYLFQIDK